MYRAPGTVLGTLSSVSFPQLPYNTDTVLIFYEEAGFKDLLRRAES